MIVSRFPSSLLQAVWLSGCLVLGCSGQLPLGGGHLGGGGLGPLGTGGLGYSQRPMGGLYGSPGYIRPAGYQSEYGYGYSSSAALRKEAAPSASEEALDLAEKTATAPLNSVMSSLPSLAPQVFPVLPSYQQLTQQLTGSSSSRDASSGGAPCRGENCSQAQGKSADSQPVSDGDSRVLPSSAQPASSTSGCSSSCCPCANNYLSWLYAAYPFFDPSRYTVQPYYPKTSATNTKRSSSYSSTPYSTTYGIAPYVSSVYSSSPYASSAYRNDQRASDYSYVQPASSYSMTQPASSYSNAQRSSSYSNAQPTASYSNAQRSSSYSNAQRASSNSNAQPAASYSNAQPTASYSNVQPSSGTHEQTTSDRSTGRTYWLPWLSQGQQTNYQYPLQQQYSQTPYNRMYYYGGY